MGIKHTKVSNVADAANTSLVRPTDWNADHTIDGDVDFGGHSIVNANIESGADEFTELTDVPATYSGSADKLVAVNSTATGLEFVDLTADFTDLDDVPATYVGSGNKLVAVNAGATGLEFIAPSAGGPVDEFTDLLDVPGSYAGQTGKVVAVNAGETALEFIDASGSGIDGLDWVRPQDYYANAGQPGYETATIDASTIAAHPEWIGTYKTGSYWSYVAIQEAIYGALAHVDSTPGNVVWNRQNARRNKNVFIPSGGYLINHRLLISAQGFNFVMSNRLGTNILVYPGRAVVGDSHGTNVIDGISSASCALLDVRDKYFIRGPGIGEGRRVTAVGANSITLDDNTLTSVSDKAFYLWHSGLTCDAAAYATFHNVSITAGNPMPRASTFDDSVGGKSYDGTSEIALFVLDWSGDLGGLRTQQVTIYDTVLTGSFLADCLMSISPSGGAAQGDTILIVNPIMHQSRRDGLIATGANALNIQIINGNFQYCQYAGIRSIAGSVYVNGTSFQVGTYDFNSSPRAGHVANMGADIMMRGGGGPSSACAVHNIRSEGTRGVHAHSEADPDVNGYGLSFADLPSRGNLFPYQLGDAIHQGAPLRHFICVSTSGPDQWFFSSTIGTGPQTTITLTGASFTVNEWVGRPVLERYGSNSYTVNAGDVVSNTANTITISGAVEPTTTSLYFIGGLTAASNPGTFTACADSTAAYDPIGVGQGISVTRNSTIAQIGSQFTVNNGDYIVVPNVDSLGLEEDVDGDLTSRLHPIICPLITRVISYISGSSFNIGKAPKFTATGNPGWIGTDTVTDGDIIWMPIDVYSYTHCRSVTKSTADRILGCSQVTGLRIADPTSGTFWCHNSNLATSGSGLNNRNFVTGQTFHNLSSNIEPGVSPVDISDNVNSSHYSRFTPTQNITLNAVSVGTNGASQEWYLIVVTSGSTSYTITFGTNILSTGTLATGVTHGKRFIIKFITHGTELFEVSRTAAL